MRSQSVNWSRIMILTWKYDLNLISPLYNYGCRASLLYRRKVREGQYQSGMGNLMWMSIFFEAVHLSNEAKLPQCNAVEWSFGYTKALRMIWDTDRNISQLNYIKRVVTAFKFQCESFILLTISNLKIPCTSNATEDGTCGMTIISNHIHIQIWCNFSYMT